MRTLRQFSEALLGCLLLAAVSVPAHADTLVDIQKRGVVLVGTQFSFPNWGFYDDQRQAAGFDIDMAKELAAGMKVRLELVETITQNRIPYLEAKKVDLVMSVFSITPERALRVAFSRPYASLVGVVFSKKGDGIESPKDLAGKRVAVSKGSTSGARIRALAPRNTTFLEFETPGDMFLAMRQGKADAGAEGLDGVTSFIKQNPTFAIKAEPLAPHSLVAVGVRQDDHTLLQWLNTWLLTLENTGRIDELYKKWFGIDRPPMPR